MTNAILNFQFSDYLESKKCITLFDIFFGDGACGNGLPILDILPIAFAEAHTGIFNDLWHHRYGLLGQPKKLYSRLGFTYRVYYL